MPIPAAPPPGATSQVRQGTRQAAKSTSAAAKTTHDSDKPADKVVEPVKKSDERRAEPTPRSTGTNDLLAFLTFVEHHKPGSSVNAIVENYSSHGAYVRIGEVKGYVPLSLMSDPPPRSAREFMKIGESITLVVESFAPARRSIDLAIPTMTTVKQAPAEPPVEVKPKRATKKAAAKATATKSAAPKANIPEEPVETAEGKVGATPAPPAKKRGSKKVASSRAADVAAKAAPKSRVKKAAASSETLRVVESAGQPARKRSAKKAPAVVAPIVPDAVVRPTRRRAKSA